MWRVGHITPWGIACGVARHLSYWIPSLPPERPQIILAERPPAWYPSVSDAAPCRLVRTWDRSRQMSLPSICGAIAHEQVQIAHFQWDPGFFPADAMIAFGVWARQNGIRSIFTAHCFSNETLWLRANKALLRAADQVVVGTPGMVETVNEFAAGFHVAPRRPVALIPLPAPEPPLDLSPVQIGLGKPLILSWGFLGSRKGFLETAEAVARLRASGFPDASYLIIGQALTGEQKKSAAEIQAFAENHSAWCRLRQDDVSEDELYRICAAADLVVLNHQFTNHSSSGTVALSVMSGTPVVVSRSPMFSGYVEAGAVRVASPGIDGLASAMWSTLIAPEELDKGRQEMIRRIHPAVVAAQYEALYRLEAA